MLTQTVLDSTRQRQIAFFFTPDAPSGVPYLCSCVNNVGGDTLPACGDRVGEHRYNHGSEDKDVGGMPNSPSTARGTMTTLLELF